MEGEISVENRAQWQRSEAMVIFDAEARWVMDATAVKISDTDIQIGIQGIDEWSRNAPTAIRSVALVARLSRYFLNVSEAFTGPVFPVSDEHKAKIREPDTQGRDERYTAGGITYGTHEGIRSNFFLPLNLLTAADVRLEETGKSRRFTSDLPTIISNLRSDWFYDVCDNAAFTANGVWAGYAAGESHGVIFAHLDQYLQFDIQEQPEPQFRFTTEAIQRLRSHIKARNEAFLKERHEMVVDNHETGTTSGCPVRHTKPHFTDSISDEVRIAAIARYYNKTPEAIIEPRQQSAIKYTLDVFAEFLDRVHAIDQAMASSRS